MGTEVANIQAYSDQELIQLILETGETEHFGILYDRYANKVYRKCLSIVKETNTAQDLSQDILVKAFLSLPKFEGKSKFSSWLYSITYNKCIDYLRNQQKYKEIEFDPSKEPGGIDDDDQANEEIVSIKVSRLRKLMEKLSEEDRLILLMKYQDEMSIQDIERILEIGSSAVKMRLKRARERLRDLYRAMYRNED